MRLIGIGLLLAFVVAGCRSPSVNGTTLRPEPTCNAWTAVVTNPTTRVYDLYIGTRVIGTADPGTTTRTVIEPQLGRVTPRLRESPTTRDYKGARLSQSAIRMVCE
jgi:hypothetical protein